MVTLVTTGATTLNFIYFNCLHFGVFFGFLRSYMNCFAKDLLFYEKYALTAVRGLIMTMVLEAEM